MVFEHKKNTSECHKRKCVRSATTGATKII